MTSTSFIQLNSLGGYIGRLAWWNTMDTQAINPHCPVNVRFWGKGPFLLQGWGSAK